MEPVPNPNVTPVGPGGILGRIFRMVVMICTGGFIYPNTFTEGVDCTAIQRETMGTLYDKKKEPGKRVG